MPWLFIIFIFVPMLEIWGILQVGSWIGAGWTFALILLSALAGSFLLKQQGLQTLFRARQKLDQGEMPLHEMLEGILLAISGALLLTPGFFTDFVGLFLLLPAGRDQVIRMLVKNASFVSATKNASGEVHSIEGEFRREE